MALLLQFPFMPKRAALSARFEYDPEEPAEQIAEFRDSGAALSFDLAPETAVQFFAAKGLKPTFAWQDMLAEEHLKAFTVAKMMDADMLADVHNAMTEAITEGKTVRWFQEQLEPMMQAKGWWGKKLVEDPLAIPTPAGGKFKIVQLGSAPRLRTIFRTNMQNAYAVGHWEKILAQKEEAPFLMYDALDDHRTRPAHAALDNKVLPVDHPFWKTHAPPNGWNCRCSLIQLDADQMESLLGKTEPDTAPAIKTRPWTNPRTGKVLQVPVDLDPGWDYNPGRLQAEHLATLALEKTAALPPKIAAGVRRATRGPDKARLAVIDKQRVQAAAKDLAQAEGLRQLARGKAKVAKLGVEINAQNTIADIAAGKLKGTGLKFPKALKKLEVAGELAGLTNTAKLAKVEALAAEIEVQHKITTMVGKYKKSVLAGKIPTKLQKEAFAKLDEAAQLKVLNDIADKQLAQAAAEVAAAGAPKVTPARAMSFDDFIAIGPQKGSNPGGLYQNFETGETWYIKTPPSADHARNEVLAARLYELAGVEVAEVQLIMVNGQQGVASRIIDGLAKDSSGLASAAGAQEGFAVDAWLSNWDVVGLEFDNLLVKGGRAIRVDTGGALRYRAQGGLKGEAFAADVGELETFRDARLNTQAAQVFGEISIDKLEASARRVIALDDDHIRQIVDQYGPEDAIARHKLYATLIERKANVRSRFPHLTVERAAPGIPRAGERVTDFELQQIRNARINGLALRADQDHIEDQTVLIWHEKAEGAAQTVASLKVRGDGAAALKKLLGKQGGKALADFQVANDTLADKIVTAIKGVAMRAGKGEAFDAKDFQRISDAQDAFTDLVGKMDRATLRGEALAATTADMLRHHKAWMETLDEIEIKYKAGDIAKWDPPSSSNFTRFEMPGAIEVGAVEAPAVKFTRSTGAIRAKNIKKGRATVTQNTVYTPDGDTFVAEVDGVRVRYWAEGGDVPFALQNQLELTVAGDGVAESGRIFDTLEKLGVKAARTTPEDLEELYLRQIANHMNKHEIAREMDKIADQGERLVKARALVSKAAGVSDITRIDSYKPQGRLQAFESGRAHTMRPDLVAGKEWADFTRDHRLHHHITNGRMAEQIDQVLNNGGQMAPTVDKLRRGIKPGGMSPGADLDTGGASYFFTRLQRRRNAVTARGLVWKSELLGRLDAISYPSDMYGKVTGTTVRDNRVTGIADWKDLAGRGSNETILKNSLSLFDDLDVIVTESSAERRQVLEVFKKHGIDRWPDGRALEDVVK